MSNRAFRVRLSFWGVGAEYLFPTQQDAEHVAHYFREHLNQRLDDHYSFLFKTSRDGFIASLTDPDIEKEIWFAPKGGTWRLWDRFTARSNKSTPLPPLSVPPVNETYTCFHAASASTPSGRGVMFLGPSYSGKTVLSLKLAFAGWGLLTDDLSVVDPKQMQIRAFRRPVGLRENTFDILPQLHDQLESGAKSTRIIFGSVSTHMVHASDLGLDRLPERARLHAVVMLSNSQSHSKATLVELQDQAIVEMLRDNHVAGLSPSLLNQVSAWQLNYNLERDIDVASLMLSEKFEGLHV